ncbi:putative mediator of RNA polymerase II transcription subunit 26 [Malaya genurostris]|uniref:putative mediator of RNA polymerase II transcription subunit 26 n=1 Tax=Malaya genurostris TaxID=325434 RepID=UPI0026F383FF|nr:putative mediator of RNA polymerase II transcription subunit 26 [Malaya genurostris]
MGRLILFVCFLITGVLSQGFLQPPPFRPFQPQPKLQRRQLTQHQQSHILSDIQQHQHRFNLHQNQRPQNVVIQPSIQLPIPPQPINQRPFPNVNNNLFQANPPPFNNKPLSPQVPPNNFRPHQSSRQQHNGFGAQQETRHPPPPPPPQPQLPQPSQQQHRPGSNTFQQPQQQVFNGPQSNNQHFGNNAFNADGPSFSASRLPETRPPNPSVQNAFLQPPSFPAQQTSASQIRFPTNVQAPQAQALFQAPPQQAFPPNQQTPHFNQAIVQQPFDSNHIRSEVVPLAQQPLQTSNFNPFAAQQNQQQFNNFPPAQNVPVFAPAQVLNSQPGVFPQIPQLNQHQQSFAIQNQQQQQQLQQLTFQQQQEFENRLKEESVRIRDLQERQKVIQKHEQFLQKQYQKQQAKVQQLHQEFIKKQQKQQDYETIRKTPVAGSQIVSAERTPYDKATKAHQVQTKLNPTTASSNLSPSTTERSLSVLPLKTNNKKDYSTISKTDLDALLQSNRQNLFQNVKNEAAKPTKTRPTKTKSTKALGRDELLKQLKAALEEQGHQDLGSKNFSSTDIVLPNGEKVQVIRTSDPDIIKRANVNSEAVLTHQADSPTTSKPLSFDDIAKSGILPPGADFELIKQSEDGQIEEVAKIPPQKKVTFVYLEEQDDGSYKVQGVKGSNDKETKTSGADVDSILKRIKNGEIQLPPPSNKALKVPIIVENPSTTTTQRIVPVQKASSVTIIPHSTPLETHHMVNFVADHSIPRTVSSPTSTTYVSTASPSSPSSVTAYSPSTHSGSTIHQSSPIVSTQSTIPSYYHNDNTIHYNGVSSTYPTSTSAPTVAPIPVSTTAQYGGSTRSENYISSSTLAQQTASSNVYQQQVTGKFDAVSPTASTPESTVTAQNVYQQQKSEQSLPLVQQQLQLQPQPQPQQQQQEQQSAQSTSSLTNELPVILRKNGLFAMAKYLRQSGLDTILNETGPYTIFVPTDKAFRSLLVQLGGPEKAEEKFKNNPRLLSGLLLHHVIPGSFEIGTLQDEMTGVSLAGTQLRVNQYNMHDSEWNDVKVTTINGAMIVPDKQDIVIPQGIAHAVDRVMFPLPVGDILQTLQSDRERRFTHFLRALYASGMSDTLQNKGIKTYTVFAPTDAAFANYSTDELNKLVTDKDQSEELVKKHVIPGTLFTAGMRFYQVKDAMAEGKTVTLQKSGGKIKINDGYLQTSNIPTTNGVIHAVDSLL